MARLTPAIIFEVLRRPGRAGRRCQHPDCDEDGIYRAPMARDWLNSYYWFCLDHVRIYNQSWDYYAGMDEAQIEAHRRRDTVWRRPSWPFGGNGHRWHRRLEDGLRADFADVFEETGSRSRRPPNEQEKALSILDLASEASFDEIRARYKKLAKKLHPDANGRDSEAEERLKAVNQAYAVLRDWRG